MWSWGGAGERRTADGKWRKYATSVIAMRVRGECGGMIQRRGKERAKSRILVEDLNTRVARRVVRVHGARRRETERVLVEEDVALVLDKLALLEHTVDLGPASGAAAEVDAVLGKALAERIGRLPGMIVGDLARDVVENVRLRDAVRRKGTEPAHHAAEVTEEVAVEGSERSTGESELRSTVVGQDRVGVLEESNEDEPVVHPGVPTSEPSV